jgi:hypothetical protein
MYWHQQGWFQSSDDFEYIFIVLDKKLYHDQQYFYLPVRFFSIVLRIGYAINVKIPDK